MKKQSLLILLAGIFALASVSCMPVTTCPHYEGENILNDNYEEPEDQGDDDGLPDYGEGIKLWLSADKNDYGTSVVTDGFGGVYVTGVIQLQEDNGDLGRVFITKFNDSLDVLWTKVISYTENEKSTAMAVDNSGSIYVAGVTYGSIGGDFKNQGEADLFLAKFNGEGEIVWARQWGSEEDDVINSMAIDRDDNIYVTGRTTGEFDGNMNIGKTDFFVTKFNDKGTKKWTKQLGTDEHESAMAIATDSENNVIVAGATNGELDHCEHAEIDPEHPYYSDSFLMKFDGDGTKLWTRQWGTENDDYALSISINSNDSIYVLEDRTARMEWNVDDTFVTSFDGNGIKKTSKELYLAPVIYGNSIMTDSNGSVFVNGSMYEYGSNVVFLAKTDKNGNLESLKKINSALELSGARTMDIDKDGNIFMTGKTPDDWGDPEEYTVDAFLMKFNAEDL
ncbi:MAG TPA: SBBP repeat-containing protein [bacterium]|nr:SBBP repeat-containing protein [bacterium]